MRKPSVLVSAAALLLLSPGATLAVRPEHAYEPAPPLDVAAGELCDFPMRLANTIDRQKMTVFAPAPDGSQRTLFRGFVDGAVTNLETGETYPSKGGGTLTIRTYADGSMRVDGRGATFFVWYFEGDDVNVEPGFYDLNGHVTEWYAPDGSLVRAVVRGRTLDVCSALAE